MSDLVIISVAVTKEQDSVLNMLRLKFPEIGKAGFVRAGIELVVNKALVQFPEMKVSS